MTSNPRAMKTTGTRKKNENHAKKNTKSTTPTYRPPWSRTAQVVAESSIASLAAFSGAPPVLSETFQCTATLSTVTRSMVAPWAFARVTMWAAAAVRCGTAVRRSAWAGKSNLAQRYVRGRGPVARWKGLSHRPGHHTGGEGGRVWWAY